MFRASAKDYTYSDLVIPKATGENLFLPVELDTEYTHPVYDINNPSKKICTNLTVQVRAISEEVGVIYAHKENPTPRHKVFEHGCVVFDYLVDKGHALTVSRMPSWETSVDAPTLQIDIYSFFAVAELARIFQGVYLDDVLSLTKNPTAYGIEQGRRLRTYTKISNQFLQWVELPWLLNLDGHAYRVRLCIWDICAIHGIASYANFCSNSGVKLIYKDNFTSAEKASMDKMYNERPEDFDNYALGDLYNYNALLGNIKNFLDIYTSLGLEKYFSIPRPTIGATISRMMEAAINNLFGCEPGDKTYINAFCTYSSADWLKRKSTSTACLNAKVDGGRCRNNRPIDTVAKGVICDIDISSCYGEGLRVQTYPLGVPIIIDYPIQSTRNNYETLRQFLKRYDKELVPGLWQCRVSFKEGSQLKYKHDYLASWFPPNDLSKELPTDTDYAGTDQWWNVDNVGEIKILNYEITHAIITHDFIQWLDNVASPRQSKELLDNLLVETAMFYPASERVDNVSELAIAHDKHAGKNTTKALVSKRRSKKISVEMECHAWYGIGMGVLIVDKLLLERRKYPKKTPFNDLYKLCINTLYGDMVSPFFKVGNVVVGNNITARARALAWCMEKGLHGWQSITDGCAFDINTVLYPRKGRNITGEMSVNLYADGLSRSHTFKPLVDNAELSVTLNSMVHELSVVQVVTDDGIVDKASLDNLSCEASLKWVNKAAMEHLQRLFPNLDILHQVTTDVYGNERVGQFEFEAKGFYDSATFHGTANYSLSFNGVHKFAMRSYSKRGNKLVTLDEELHVSEAGAKPSETFLLSLQSPNKIPRGNVYIKERILKVGDYRKNIRKWEDTEVYPGCTVEVAGLLHEFSLSQFTFQTYEQFKSWEREYLRLTRKYSQSYEMFFLNEDGTLNYQEMVETIDAAIRDGKKNFFDGMDKRLANLYREYLNHQELACLERVREQLSVRYHGAIELSDRSDDVITYDCEFPD